MSLWFGHAVIQLIVTWNNHGFVHALFEQIILLCPWTPAPEACAVYLVRVCDSRRATMHGGTFAGAVLLMVLDGSTPSSLG